MEKTEMMKRYEAETDEKAKKKVLVMYSTKKYGCGRERNSFFFTNKFVEWLLSKFDKYQAKAAAYDRLMSGNSKMTMQEMANFKGRPVTVNADGTIDAHGAEPHLARGEFAGYSDCWANDADDYEEIPESFVEIPDVFNWTTSLTLPYGWEANNGHQ